MIEEDKDIRTVSSISEIVDCIGKTNYGTAAKELIELIDSYPKNKTTDYFRVMTVPYLFHQTELLFKSEDEATTRFNKVLVELTTHLKSILSNHSVQTIFSGSFESSNDVGFEEEVKKHTGQHYGTLFREFDHKSYFEEAKNLLATRLTRNNLTFTNLDKMSLLDQGCGGGRYTMAWRLIGVGKAVGLDFSEIGIEDAKRRAELANVNNIEFVQGSVLEMPFEDNSFDIVYSNGVLHHTENWRKGIAEQLRVMKSGGWGWQYLIENPGGIFWDNIEILRAILRNVDKAFAQDVMRSMGIPTNRIFYMLDHSMVPINTRLTAEEIADELAKNGAINITRLTRGTDFDRVEQIFNNIPYAKEKFGIGENRIVFNKK